MNAKTKTSQKAKTIEIMKQLDIYEPYVEAYEKKDQVCFFEGFAGYWVEQEEEIYEKMKELENEYGMKVYAITHELTKIGEIWDFICISKYPEEWGSMIYDNGNSEFNVFAYCWNKDCDWLSEFGDITVKSLFGGIRRIY